MVGATTIACTALGAAIGSGIFRTPGDVAMHIASPWLILLIWLAAGIITLMQSLVTAELATRFPMAGGEYQYLKEAYGRFVAFFFGWSCTIFILGAGAGTVAAAFGDFGAELAGWDAGWASPAIGAAAIVIVVTLNAAGLRTGAVTQNLLTALKTLAVLGIAAGALIAAGGSMPSAVTTDLAREPLSAHVVFIAALAAFWPYTGATDPARLAEEMHDVQRGMPRALISAVCILTAVYLAYNYALLCALSPDEMAGRADVHAMALSRRFGEGVRVPILLVSMLICAGTLSAMFLANVRVTYAMARDGLAPRRLAAMSRHQSPVASLLLSGLLACAFVANRRFEQILQIYFLAASILFGLTYLSLIVFRLRDERAGTGFPPGVYRAPAGVAMACLLIGFQAAIGASIVWSDVRTWVDEDATAASYDSVMTLGLLAGLAVFYVVWTRALRR